MTQSGSLVTNSSLPSVLAVPMDVEALVVTKGMASSDPRRRWVPNFNLTAVHRSPEPPPLTNAGPNSVDPDDDIGVYLRWQLPRALCHGRTQKDGGIEFPLVPNCWVVIRYRADADPVAWVVESDYLHPRKNFQDQTVYDPDQDVRDDGVPYVYPYAEESTAGGPTRSSLVITRVGRKKSLEDWVPPYPAPPQFLTAVGPGLTTFHSFQPYHQDVFSLHDTLTGVPRGVALTYLVVGWYTDAESDILQKYQKDLKTSVADATPEQIRDRLQELLGWQLPKDPADLPARTVCYGRAIYVPIDDIKNLDAKGPVSRRPTSTENVTLAIGNTMTDAMTALLRASDEGVDEQLATAFEALQNGLFALATSADGQVRTTQCVHQSWFGERAGGTRWSIRLRMTEEEKQSEKAAVSVLPEAELARLNQTQTRWDSAQRRLAALQWRLYALWGVQSLPKLSGEVTRDELRAQLLRTQEGSAAYQVAEQQQSLTRLHKDISELQEKINDDLAKSQTHELVSENWPSFYRALNPSLVIRGAYGGMPPVLVTPGLLPCRVSSDLSADSYTPSHARNLTDTQWTRLPVQVTPLARLLATETLRMHDLAWTAAQEGGTPQEIAARYQKKLEDHKLGSVPQQQLWEQPWSPLFLQWKGRYYYIPFKDSKDPDEKPLTWVFDGTRYVCKDLDDESVTKNEKTRARFVGFEGRQVLGALPQYNLREQFTTQLELLPDTSTKKLTELLDKVEGWDLLSLSLDGFTEQLAARDPSSNLGAPPGLQDLIGEECAYLPDVGPPRPVFGDWGAAEFAQLRAGWFAFTQLQVLDRFGQTLDLIKDEGTMTAVAHVLSPHVKPDVNPAPDSRRVQVRPRFLQHARVRFDILSAQQDTPVDLLSDASPVCAWILPHYLDKSLLCYDKDGLALGELRLTLSGTTPTSPRRPRVGWFSLPPDGPDSVETLATTHRHLHDFATYFTTADHDHESDPDQRGRESFLALLGLVDASLSTIEPDGAINDSSLVSMMLGRPLCLLRVRLRIELDGPPLYDPSWRNIPALCDPAFFPQAPQHNGTHERRNGEDSSNDWTQLADILRYQWPIRLGQENQLGDGLIGYFLDSGDNSHRYYTMFTVHDPPIPDDYLSWIGPERNADPAAENFLRLSPVPAVEGHYQPSEQVTEAHLTLLCDPQATIHATTDLLPVTTITVPGKYLDRPLASIRTAFRFTPFLSTTRPNPERNNAQDLVLPLPTAARGTWSWAQRPDPDQDTEPATWQEHPVTPADPVPRFEELLPISHERCANHTRDAKGQCHLGPVLRSGALMLTSAFGDPHDTTKPTHDTEGTSPDAPLGPGDAR